MKVRFESKNSKSRLILIICLTAAFLAAVGVGLFFLLRDRAANEGQDYLLQLREILFEVLPSEAEDDVIFPTVIEGYEDVTIVYQSQNEAILTSEGKVKRGLEDVNVLLLVTLSHPEYETVSFQKGIQVKKLVGTEVLEFAYDQVVIDPENADGAVLPVSIPEYGITITYEPFAMRNGEYVRSISVEVQDDKAIVHVSAQGERKACSIVAKFTFAGSTFTHNYLVYTVE